MRWALVALSLLAALPSYAEPEVFKGSSPLPADAPLVLGEASALVKGEPAPASGILLREEAFRRVLVQQAELDRARAQVKARDEALAKALPLVERTPLERWGFWIGLGIGVASGAAIGAVIVMQAKK